MRKINKPVLIFYFVLLIATIAYAAVTQTDVSTDGTHVDDTHLKLAHDNSGILKADGAGAVSAADGSETYTPFLNALKMNALTSEPTETVGHFYKADGDNWDPGGYGGSTDYIVLCTAENTYKTVLMMDATLKLASIETPSYAHFTNADAIYSDNSTPHVLTETEVKNTHLTNAGATEDRVYTLPTYAFGWSFCMEVIAAYQMDLEPPSGGKIMLNGTDAAVDEHIINAADTKGDLMCCWSVEVSNGTYETHCKSDNSNWAEATP